MAITAPTPGATARKPLEQLVALARSAREDPLAKVLEAVAHAVAESCSFRSLALNVYRPAFDEYEVVLVTGSAAMAAALRGRRMPADEITRLLEVAEQRVAGTYFLTIDTPGWIAEDTFVPDLPVRDAPGAWRAEDGLLVPLTDTDGAPLGFLSVDEPESGRRPADDELRLLRAICSHAEQALESARDRAEDEILRTMSTRLLAASTRVSLATSRARLGEVLADTVVQRLGFERVAIYGGERDGTFVLTNTRGWTPRSRVPSRLSVDRVGAVMAAQREHAGTWLLAAEELFGSPGEAVRSRRNGRGPHGWRDHCLLVPARGIGGALVGIVVVEDPVDHRIPGERRANLLRLFVDQATTAWSTLQARDIQDRLLGLMLVREDAPALADALAHVIRAPVALFDWSGQTIARADWEGHSVAVATREELHRRAAAPDADLIVRALELGDAVEGYLVVEGTERSEPIRGMAVEQAALSFALHLAMRGNAEEVEHRLRGSLIDELLDSATVDLELLSRRVRRFGHELATLTAALAVAPVEGPELASDRSTFIYLARTVRSVLERSGCEAIIAPRSGSVLALLAARGEPELHALGARLVEQARAWTGIEIAVGISRRNADPAGLAAAVREAQQALHAARALPGRPAVALAGELELRQLLLAAPRAEEVRRAAARLLDPLLSGSTRGGELVATLAAYLASVGQLEASARRLGIHVNTLRHRLGRIEELLGRDLRDAGTRVDLQLALELLGHAGSFER